MRPPLTILEPVPTKKCVVVETIEFLTLLSLTKILCRAWRMSLFKRKPQSSSVRGTGLSHVNGISRCARVQSRQFEDTNVAGREET